MSNEEASIQRFVVRCQLLCARVDNVSVNEWLPEFHQLASYLPVSATRPEQLVIRGLLCEVVLGVAKRLTISGSRTMTSIGELALSRHWPGDLRAAFERCVERIVDQMRIQSQPARAVTDERVKRAIDTIRNRHAVQRLTLGMIAREVGISTRHLARLFRHSGGSFERHLHRIRLLHAQHLLRTTDLRVKEIAHTVGYLSTTQLDRHFTQQCGMSPKLFRSVLKQIAEYSQ